MSPKNLKKVNELFSRWRGSRAEFNHFHTSMGNVFGIGLFKGSESIGVMFATCFYIQGPTNWDDCDLVCETWFDDDGVEGFEVKDQKAGFVVRAGGGISAGDGAFCVGVHE